MNTIDLDQLSRVTGGSDVRPSIDQVGRPYEPRPLPAGVKPADQVPRPPDFSPFYA